MIYFDTDVLVHFVVAQETSKQVQAKELIFDAVKSEEFCISLLTLQEFLFVLEKLKVDKKVIDKNYSIFRKFRALEIDKEIFDRAYEIAKKVGFKHINDSLHTAIAEKYCTKLITCNKADFKKIQKVSSVLIEIL